MDTSSRVYVVAQSYPPVGGSHATRVAAVVPRLSCGAQVVGVAPDIGGGYPNRSGGDRLPVKIVRTFPGVGHAVAHGRATTTARGGISDSSEPSGGWLRAVRVTGLVSFLFRAVQVVDSYFDWIPHLARTVRRSVRPGDVVLSMSMPHSAHVGVLLGLRGRDNHWVVDMADPWTLDRSRPRLGWKLAMERWLEHRVLRRANAIHFVTERMLLDYRECFPQYADKMKLSRMGYEAKDQCVPAKDFSNRPVVFYGGNLPAENRDATVLLAVIEELSWVSFIFAGGAVEVVRRYFADQVPKNVQLMRWLGHEEYCGFVRGADACIIFGNQNPQQVPGKVYQLAGLAQRVLYFPRMPAAEDEALVCLGANTHVFGRMSGEELAREITEALVSPKRSSDHETYTWDRTLGPLLADVMGKAES